jgi:hypothetical protein
LSFAGGSKARTFGSSWAQFAGEPLQAAVIGQKNFEIAHG